MNDKLEAVKEKYQDSYHVYNVRNNQLELYGGGDFYSNDNASPDEETWALAKEIAEEAGMHITNAYGVWMGWSEYTPDPGNVSVFRWEPL